jgi:hypothetical protein
LAHQRGIGYNTKGSNMSATTEREASRQRQFVFKIGFEGKPEKPIESVAYLFDRRGRLLASSPLKGGQAEFTISEAEIRAARLFFGPVLPKERFRNRRPTLETMARLQAHEPSWRFQRDKSEYELMPIPEVAWRWWLWCRCHVRGRVVKTVSTGGVSYEVPVCNARVHICEVDRLLLLIPRLPDPVIWRLRDELLRLLVRPPFPIPPEPEPGPFAMPEPIPTPSAIPEPIPTPSAIPEPIPVPPSILQARQLARARQVVGPALRSSAAMLSPRPQPRARLVAVLGPQPEPPDQPAQFSSLARLSPTFQAALSSNAVAIVRQTLIDHIELVQPWICLWDWLWPYFYRCDEVAVVMTDANGRFEADVWYLCFGDHPDLYFSADYPIDGVWQSVYHPAVRCHTYWNYICGSEMTIHITDPRVPGCWDHAVVPGKKVVIKSIGPNVSMSDINHGLPLAEIDKEGTGKAGEIADITFPEWTGKAVAFGGLLEPRVDFGTGLKGANITHYLWSYRQFGSTDDADWKPIAAEVRRHYRVATPPADPVKYSSVKLGPDADGLFEIEPVLPADGEDWEVLNEHYDLASAHFDSAAASGVPGEVGYGQFELKLELFRKAGGTITRIDLTAESVDINETTSPAPFLADEIFTGVPANDRVLREWVGGALHVVGYRLVLLVDNRVCFGTIDDVTVSGVGAGPCGFLEYDPAADPAPSAEIAFRASHPGNFAGFSFVTTRVTTHLPSASAHGLVEATSANGFGRTGNRFSKSIPVGTLLHELESGTSCVRAAFAETLHVYALVTDGYWRLSYLDAPRPDWEDPAQIDVRAFALTPEEPAP